MATITVVRHGETEWNRDGRVQGWADSSLTARGRRQARITGDHLASTREVDHLVVSDLGRALETAAALEAGGLGVESTVSRAWRERGFGEYQGLTRAELADRFEGFEPDDPLFLSADVPGGESLATVRERTTGGFERLRADLDDGETAVVVTHGGPIHTLVASVTGRDLPAVAREVTPANCGLTVIDAAGDPSLRRENDTAHLPDG